jgi:hypothetical protein
MVGKKTANTQKFTGTGSDMEAILACYADSSDSDAARDHEESAQDEDDGGEYCKSKKRKHEQPRAWVRSFKHVDGNWPSHVYIPGATNLALLVLIARLLVQCEFNKMVHLENT